MEDEKKKRNKKKKNRQQNNKNKNDDNKVTTGEFTSIDPQKDHVSRTGLIGQVPESTNAETDVKQNVEDLFPNNQEASLQEKIRLLQVENNVLCENEATMRAKVENLLKQIIQKETSLEERLKQFKSEKEAYEEKEATLQEKLVQLQKEREAHLQKEASLEENVRQLQKEKEILMQEKVAYEEKINQLVNEAATLSLKGNFEETIANLHRENTQLHVKVMDLKEQWNCLLQENQLLKENISALQSNIEDLKKIAPLPSSSSQRQMDAVNNGDVNSETDATHMLIEKLISENAELFEKVNALSIELARRGLTEEVSSIVDSHPESGLGESVHVAESSIPTTKPVFFAATTQETGQDPAAMLYSDPRLRGLQSMENMAIKDERTLEDYLTIGNMSLTNSSEIVQIPLDDNEIQVLNSEAAHDEGRPDVPLTDAPLIGAPFRLIGFVARYVSGADLVNKGSPN